MGMLLSKTYDFLTSLIYIFIIKLTLQFFFNHVIVPLLGSIMDVRNNEENMMLQTFLNSPLIWPKIRELVRKLSFPRHLIS